MRNILLITALIFISCTSIAKEHLTVEITALSPDSRVPYRPFVEGRVSNPNAAVWVVIHPLAVSNYWVQPRVSVHQNGLWTVQVYIGEPGSKHIGQRFEIRAFANPKGKLHEGDILTDWPRPMLCLSW